MFVSRFAISRIARIGSLLALLVAVPSAMAQHPSPYSAHEQGYLAKVRGSAGFNSVTVNAEANRASISVPHVVHRNASPLPVTRPSALEVVVERPAAQAEYIAIRGPDGTVRNFPIQGGTAAIQTQKVIVHAGESVRIDVGGPLSLRSRPVETR